MINNIHIEQYRKLKALSLPFSNKLNAISGTNGTCKTSLLHIFSNSFQAVTKKCDWVNTPQCLSIISSVNAITNPKVESLTRGDKNYNNPAKEVKGVLFTVDYFNREPLGFRRHNSSVSTRYAVKPMYKKGTKDELPFCPTIYLGLSRLVPFGEYQNDEAVSAIKKKLPEKYQAEIASIYKKFTHFAISYTGNQRMGDVKNRAEFSSDYEGIDSNTISAGEDNLYIILSALISLKYYYESITTNKTVESVLLIDEIDATLHPAYQIKLLDLMREFSTNYKIQIIFTTHSMSLIESMLNNKDNVLYLLDNISDVALMEEPDIYKIKMHLHSLTENDIFAGKDIPIFTEDAEARFLLKMLFEYFREIHSEVFISVENRFHFVEANMGADNLKSIFSDLKVMMRAICVLDGDQGTDLSNCIVALPGGDAPEKILCSYAKSLIDENNKFWTEKVIIDRGYSKRYYIDEIDLKINEFEQKLVDEHENGTSSKGKRRVFYKQLFIDNKNFFTLLYKHWLHNPNNSSGIEKFYSSLRSLFKKVALYYEINPKEWQ